MRIHLIEAEVVIQRIARSIRQKPLPAGSRMDVVTLERRSSGTRRRIRIRIRPITSKQRIRGKINHAVSTIRLRSRQNQSVIRILIRIEAVARAIVPRPRKHRAHKHAATLSLQELNLAPEIRHH